MNINQSTHKYLQLPLILPHFLLPNFMASFQFLCLLLITPSSITAAHVHTGKWP